MMNSSGVSRHFIDNCLPAAIEDNILDFMHIKPLTVIHFTGDNKLQGVAQGTILVVVRKRSGIPRTVQLPVVLVPRLRKFVLLGKKR